MQNTGNLNSLAEKMKAKTERERQELESLTRQQFDALSKSLGESSKNALSTTEAAILHQLTSLERNVTSRCRILSAAFGWKCLQALALTLCILTGAICSGWGLLTLAEKKITNLHREIITLSERKDSLEAQSARLLLNIAVKVLAQGILLGLFGGNKEALVHVGFNLLGPRLGLGLGIKGFAGGWIPFFADAGLPLIGATLTESCHAYP